MKSDTTNNWLVCRICLKQPTEEMRTIFDENDDNDLTLLILRCGGVPIKRYDHFPDKICSKCYKYLCVADKFRQICQRSHQQLSKYMAPVVMDNGTPIQDPIEPDISLHLGDHEVTLKMEPLEGADKDNDKEIKSEFTDDLGETFEPMHVEVPGGPFLDQSIEGCSISDCELLDEMDNLSSSEEENFETPISQKKTKLRYKNKPANKGIRKNTSNSSSSIEMQTVFMKHEKKKQTTSDNTKNGTEGKKRAAKKPKDSSYICDICGNLYPSQSRLTEHIKLHKGIKPYECEICGHAFAQTQQLARHMNTHTGRRPYKCNYCPAAFADVSTRNKHHRIHTNERPYVCDVCGKSFTYTNTLKFHKMTHTGEKPHVCDICGKGFQQAYKMRLHRVVHEKKGIKIPQVVKPPGSSNELLEI